MIAFLKDQRVIRTQVILHIWLLQVAQITGMSDRNYYARVSVEKLKAR